MQKTKEKVNIGIDVGIASVGWAILTDENNKIVRHGVRLFNSVDDPKDGKLKNTDRRENRSLRRRIWRTYNRKREAIKLFIKHGLFVPNIDFDLNNKEDLRKTDFIEDFKNFIKYQKNDHTNIYDLRLKFLKQKTDYQVNNIELLRILYWYMSHRGKWWENIEQSDENEKDEKKNKQINIWEDEEFKAKEFLVEKQILFNEKYLQDLNQHGIYKFKETINNQFKRSDYVNEIKRILEVQQLDSNFINDYIKLFEKQRPFEEGPGNSKTYSKYGLYLDKNMTNKVEVLWEKTVGKCQIYPEEKRFPNASASYYLYNLLNDLNNFRYNGFKLSFEEKQKIIDSLFVNKKFENLTITRFLKLLKKFKNFDSIEESDLHYKSGMRTLDNKPIITDFKKHFEPIIKILACSTKKLKEKQWKITINDSIQKFEDFIDFFDAIAVCLQSRSTQESRKEVLKNNKIINDFIDQNLTLNSCNKDDLLKKFAIASGFSKVGSYSKKALNEIIDWMKKHSGNIMQYIYEIKPEVFKSEFNFIKHKKYISHITTEWIEKTVFPPTVKRSVRQTILVLNAIFDYCRKNSFLINKIVVEMPRDHNNKQEKERIQKINKNNAKSNEAIKDIIEEYEKEKRRKLPASTLLKLKFYEEQKRKDAYDLEPIDRDDLVKHPDNYQIDHIIPYSLTYDDSQNNKVLTKLKNNTFKGQKTPYQAFNDRFGELSKSWREWYSDKKFKIKLDNLLDATDYHNDSEAREIASGRNIVDTRYIAREFLRILKAYIESKKDVDHLRWDYELKDVQIKTITGKLTYYLRKRIFENYKKTKNYSLYPSLINPLENIDENQLSNAKENNFKKDRDWFGQHAQDAVLICYAGTNNYQIAKITEKNVFSETDKNYMPNNDHEFLNQKLGNLANELNANWKKIFYSRKINYVENQKLSDETLYSSKIEDNIFYQIKKKKILELTNKELEELFNKDQEKLLLYKNNNKLFQRLKELYNFYSENQYPFKKMAEKMGLGDRKCNEGIIVGYNDQQNKKQTAWIKFLRVKSEKDSENIIHLKDNKNAFLGSLNWFWIDSYEMNLQNGEKKYFLIRSNAANTNISRQIQKDEIWNIDYPSLKFSIKLTNKKLKINKEKLIETKYLDKIVKKHKPVKIEFKNRYNRGDLLISKDEISKKDDISSVFDRYWYVVGSNKNKIEIKKISWINRQENRIIKTVDKIEKNFIKIKNPKIL